MPISRHPRQSRAISAALLALIASTSIFASPVLATTLPTTTSVSLGNTPYVDTGVVLESIVGFTPFVLGTPAGSVEWDETTSGSPVPLATANVVAGVGGGVAATYYLASGFKEGWHTIVATFTSSNAAFTGSASDPLTFNVTKLPTTTTLSPSPSVSLETHHTLTMDGLVYGTVTAPGATASIWRVGGTAPICTGLVGVLSVACSVGPLTIGTYQYVARFSGTTTVAASESVPTTVTVIPDTVHAHGVGVKYSTIYPVVDGYVDSDAIYGIRDEPTSVSIYVYSSTGAVVRTAGIALGSGAYSYAWNGRNSAGTILAEGSYRVVQVLKDAAGTIKTFTKY
ncbi:MAG TPA: FlgD immunoglobulin-like domain containing protein, partial [Candidatus Limnocylindrales bacterium]|nr:FlgD immunoglobulin-like domain containing protein [Candidatus Limnocylindrales bacterium]